MADIGRLDEQEFQGVLSDEERVQKDHLRAEWDGLAHLDEISWCQKSQVFWLRERDNNTKFFHKMAKSNRRRNLGANGFFFTLICIRKAKFGVLMSMGCLLQPLGRRTVDY